jgi:hypothetical protein
MSGSTTAPTWRTWPFPAEGLEPESIIAGEAALIPALWPVLELESATDTIFEGQIQLARVGLPRQPVQPGEVAIVTLRWHALQQVTENCAGFIHLLNAFGDMIAQDDHPAQDDHFPTRQWPQGAVLSDPFHLVLPTGLAAGSYELWGGPYRPEPVQRLEAMRQGTGERWKDDLVGLETLLVAELEE